MLYRNGWLGLGASGQVSSCFSFICLPCLESSVVKFSVGALPKTGGSTDADAMLWLQFLSARLP